MEVSYIYTTTQKYTGIQRTKSRTSLTDAQRRSKARSAYQKAKRKKQLHNRIFIIILIAVVVLIAIGAIVRIRHNHAKTTYVKADQITDTLYNDNRPDLDVELLPVNDYSRPGRALEKVNGIVVHYTANPGTTAQQNRNYFAGLAESHITHASSHFVIGLEGEIVQCIPCDEIAYASNDRNSDTIAIECCIPDDTGKFNDQTYQSLVQLVTWLMGRYDLGVEDVIRHYDVTGKNCPKYFVEHTEAWDAFKQDLVTYIQQHGVKKES